MRMNSALQSTVELGGLLAVAILLLGPAYAPHAQAPSRRGRERINGHEAASDRIILKLRPGARVAALDGLVRQVGATERRAISKRGLVLVRSARVHARDLLRLFAAHPAVEYVEPDHVVYEQFVPDDEFFDRQWGLFNADVPGADINVLPAWHTATGGSNVVIGIHDSAIDWGHVDLRERAWAAPRPFTVSLDGFSLTCPAGSHGVRMASVPSCDTRQDPVELHGTHVAGIAGAAGNNRQGTTGVNWHTRMMTLAFLNQGSGYVSDAIGTLEFAIQVKSQFAETGGANVRVINASWSEAPYLQSLEEQIDYLAGHDILFVTAAGNRAQNLDDSPTYPASYRNPNVITVAASTRQDSLTSFSNYGKNTVHLVAPGDQIYSTSPGGCAGCSAWSYQSGTSMAAPFVSGAAALVLSRCSMNTSQLRAVLLESVSGATQFAPYTSTGGRLDVGAAVQSCTASAPAAPPTIELIAPLEDTIYLAPASMPLQARAADSDGTIAAVEFYAGSTFLGKVTQPPYNVTWTNVPAGTYRVRAVAIDNGNLRTESDTRTVTVVAAAGIATPWAHADVGPTGQEGAAAFANGTFTVRGAGDGLNLFADAFHLVYRPFVGEGVIMARVASIQGAGEPASAAVTIRESLAPEAAHASVRVGSNGALQFVARTSAFGYTNVIEGPSIAGPVWVKLVRASSTVSAFYSGDGKDWIFLASDGFPRHVSSVLVGLLCASASGGPPGTSMFDHVAITTAPTPAAPAQPTLPTPAHAAVGVPTDTFFKWTAFGATSYEIRFGTTSSPPSLFVLDSPYYEPHFPLAGNTKYYWQIVASNAAGKTPGPVWSFITGASATWPSEWTNTDVGATGLPGLATYGHGRFLVTGAGADVWGDADGFHYVYQPLNDDGQIVARVLTLGDTHPFAKAGLMIRESLSPGAAHAVLDVRPGGSLEFMTRRSAGGATVYLGGGHGVAPVWVKLQRSGSTITASMSFDNQTWSVVGTVPSPSPTALIGFFVCSRDPMQLNTAQFDSVSVTRTPPPATPNTPAPASGATGVPTGTTLRWDASGASGYDVRLGTTSSPPTIATNLLNASYAPTLSANTTYYWQVVARNAAGVAVGPLWSFTTAGSASWPGAWTSTDLGATGLTGSATFADNRFTVKGAGTDVWGAADGFHYVHQPLAADGQIVVHVASMQSTHTYAKAGVMIRASLSNDAPHVMLGVRPGGQLEFMTRQTAGGTTVFIAGGTEPPPVWLKLQRTGSTIVGSASADGQAWTVIGTASWHASPAVIGFLVCSRSPTTLNTSVFESVSVTSGPMWPSAWNTADVGVTGVTGSATYASGRFTVRGAGADIWGTADSFRYVYQPLSGDGQIVVRVAGMQNTHTYAKAGIMIRGSLSPNAPHAVLDIRPGGQLEFMSRVVSGGSTTYLGGALRPVPAWVKLQRSGTVISAWASVDGVSWTAIGSTTVPLPTSAVVGLVVCSHDAAQLNTAAFDGVAVGPATSGGGGSTDGNGP